MTLELRLGLRVAERVLAWRVGVALRETFTDGLLRLDFVLEGARVTRDVVFLTTFDGLLRVVVTLRLLVTLRFAETLRELLVLR